MSPEARVKALRAAPPDGWVAFSSDEERLVAYGKTYDEAVKKAEKEGEPEPVLVKVPKDWSLQVLGIEISVQGFSGQRASSCLSKSSVVLGTYAQCAFESSTLASLKVHRVLD